MNKLIESLTFLTQSVGGCIIVLTILYVLSKIYRFIDDISNDDKKKLILDTIHEVDKNNHVRKL